jgi:uncharacterized membrane protein
VFPLVMPWFRVLLGGMAVAPIVLLSEGCVGGVSGGAGD